MIWIKLSEQILSIAPSREAKILNSRIIVVIPRWKIVEIRDWWIVNLLWFCWWLLLGLWSFLVAMRLRNSKKLTDFDVEWFDYQTENWFIDFAVLVWIVMERLRDKIWRELFRTWLRRLLTSAESRSRSSGSSWWRTRRFFWWRRLRGISMRFQEMKSGKLLVYFKKI